MSAQRLPASAKETLGRLFRKRNHSDSAQRLPASAKETPANTIGGALAKEVLNAFRHQRRKRHDGRQFAVPESMCSTPSGISEGNAWLAEGCGDHSGCAQRLPASAKETPNEGHHLAEWF